MTWPKQNGKTGERVLLESLFSWLGFFLVVFIVVFLLGFVCCLLVLGVFVCGGSGWDFCVFVLFAFVFFQLQSYKDAGNSLQNLNSEVPFPPVRKMSYFTVEKSQILSLFSCEMEIAFTSAP